MIRKALTTLALSVAVLASCASPAPAAPLESGTIPPAVVAAPALSGWNWTVATPKTVPAAQRRIEVVDQLKPTKWRVSQAVEWVDRYTASNMVTVSRCSGRAWKCVYIRGGKLGPNILGLTRGNVITIDTAKVDRKGYRSNLRREEILAHEIVHTFGYGHSFTRSNNLMRTTISHVTLYLNSAERAYLRKR